MPGPSLKPTVLPDERTDPLPGFDQALCSQNAERLANGRQADAKALEERRLCWQAVAWLKFAVSDLAS
jgi:hypothetical protein